ncbi:MAG: AzlD domain-containing protein [Eubacteriales bacterium]|nr:AzlD domain-containing protein [Eubacteriales bacterium]
MAGSTYGAILVLVMALVTAAIRALPFLVFRSKENMPKVMHYLSQVLPTAVIGMLVVYCLKDIQPFSGSHAVPELLGCAAVILLHVWKRNVLISILGGTVCYMLLIQFIL